MEEIKAKIRTIITEDRVNPKFRTLYSEGLFQCLANDVQKLIPENMTLTVADGEPVIHPKEITRSFTERYARTHLEIDTPPTFAELLDNVISSQYKGIIV